MAIQFFDGFDDYGTVATGGSNAAMVSRFICHGAQGANASMSGIFGGTALGTTNMQPNNFFFEVPLLTPVSTFILGCRFLFVNNSGSTFGYGLCFSDASDNPIVQILVPGIIGVSSVAAYRNATSGSPGEGPSGTLLGTTPVIQAANTWYELEAILTVGTGTSGSLIVKLNGATVLNLTGINTQGTAGSTVAYGGPFAFSSNSNNSFYFDDLYGCDTTGPAPTNTFLSTVAGGMGPRVYTLFPNANHSVAWTPSTGTNYSNVNSSSFQSTNYNYATASGEQDLYTIPTPAAEVGSAVGTILGVQTTFIGNENDAGTCNVQSSINSGGTSYQGTSRIMTATFSKYADLWLTDPATGSAWNATKFNTTGNVFVGVNRSA